MFCVQKLLAIQCGQHSISKILEGFSGAIMYALRTLRGLNKSLRVRSLATETKEPFPIPPFEPDRPKQVFLRRFFLGGFAVLFAWILLKPWDGQSILDMPAAPVSTQDGEKKVAK